MTTTKTNKSEPHTLSATETTNTQTTNTKPEQTTKETEIKVSVVIPVYNCEEHLRETLDGVVAQTLGDIEVILVDDGSTDSSPEILKEYEDKYKDKNKKIKVLRQQNQYAGIARNNGMQHAKGEYLVFWDSDDIFAPNALETLYNRAKETDSDITICNADHLDMDTGKIMHPTYYIAKGKYPKDKEVFSMEDIPDRILNFTPVAVWHKMYRKDFVKENNLTFQGTPSGNDIYFSILALCLAKRISIADEVLVTYRKFSKTGLTGTLSKNPKDGIYAWYTTAKELKNRGVFPRVSFANRAMENTVFQLRNLPDIDAFTEAINYLKEGPIEAYGLTDLTEDEYITRWHYDFAKMLRDDTAKDIYAWLRMRDYHAMVRQTNEITDLKKKLNAEKKKNKDLEAKAKKQEAKLTRDLEKANKTIQDIRNSKAYKLGKFFAYIPRKIKDAFRHKDK